MANVTYSSGHVDFDTKSQSFFSRMVESARKAIAYRRTLDELNRLSARELDDLGLNQADLRNAAYDAVYGR